MTAKHSPATSLPPLRLAVAPSGWLVVTKHPDGIGLDAKCVAKLEDGTEDAMKKWCEWANAYPKLVEAMRQSIYRGDVGSESANIITALLRELGEAE